MASQPREESQLPEASATTAAAGAVAQLGILTFLEIIFDLCHLFYRFITTIQ